jgi:hypothetical protein
LISCTAVRGETGHSLTLRRTASSKPSSASPKTTTQNENIC